jgi:hypothetical protein
LADQAETASAQVLQSKDLLPSILSFNDMLAAFDGHIPLALNDLVDGARSSACPNVSAWLKKRSKGLGVDTGTGYDAKIARLRDLSSSILVCKSWRALNNKEASCVAIAKAQTAKHDTRMEALYLIAAKPEARWLDRLCAMAATNDVDGLRQNSGERFETTASTRPGLFAAMEDFCLPPRRGLGF